MTDRANWKAPCAICGYNGPGFFQPATHPCVKHETEHDALLAEVTRLRAEAKRADDALDYARRQNMPLHKEVATLRAAVTMGMHYLKGRYPVPVKEKEVLAAMQAALDGKEKT